MNPKVVKSGVPERVSISCLTCGTRHDSQITGNQSYVIVGEQTLQSVKFVNETCMTTIECPKNSLNNFETRIDPLNRTSSYL